MEINRLCPGNIVKYNNRFDTIMYQLSYNEYLIDHCGTPTVVNILNMSPVELKDVEMKKLGFHKSGKKTDLNTQEKITVWSQSIKIEGKESVMNIDMYNDTPDLGLVDLTGVEHFIPEQYKYVHQIQNIFSYIINKMPIYNNQL